MSEKITQIVKAFVLENDGKDYRVVGMTSPNGFFAYVECRPEEEPNAKWEVDDTATQYQVWESDTPDFMSPVDLLTNEHLREWFDGQGYELDTTPLTPCCGVNDIWLACDECAENGDPHDYPVCSGCGAELND
jgi:hypothetical protein